MYNKTQLNPDVAMERHIYHRDIFAHYLRFSHVLNIAKIGMNILDVGCGSGSIYEVFYRNKYSPANFTGVDIRKKIIEKNKLKFPKATWYDLDVVKDVLPTGSWDIITSFEVLEHIGKCNGQKFLDNIKLVMNQDTIFLLSTPCFNGSAAKNHIYDCDDGNGVVPQEYSFNELKKILEDNFIVEDVFGTFASQCDYKHLMNDWQKNMFDHLTRYYDSNLVSNLMAPFFPENSRNCLWKLKLKN